MVSIETSDLDFVCCCQSMEFVSDYIIIQQWFPYHYKKAIISKWPRCDQSNANEQWVSSPSSGSDSVEPAPLWRGADLPSFSCYLPQPFVSCLLPLSPAGQWVICKVSGRLSKSTFMLCTIHFYPLFSHPMTRMILFILVECVDILSECMVVRRDGWLVMDL